MKKCADKWDEVTVKGARVRATPANLTLRVEVLIGRRWVPIINTVAKASCPHRLEITASAIKQRLRQNLH